MKPPPFDYEAPDSVEEALALLGDESTVIAGGQSLVPLLNLRLARPELLVDINGIEELAYIEAGAGPLRIGAMARQVALERSELVTERWPLLRQAVELVGHPQIRNRGTVGGSVAHADPAAELPVALSALDARLRLRSTGGERTLAVGEFLRGPLDTARAPDELLVEIEVPEPPEGAGAGFAEHALTHGDFAVAGAAALVVPGRHAAIALLGAGPVPLRAEAAEQALVAGASSRAAAARAAEPVEDAHRRALYTELVAEAIERAAA